MTAFLFTLILFLYWSVVGLAVISIFPPRLRILQGILISPAVGIATVILPVFLLSRAGLPVKDFAGWLLPALGALSLVVLFIRKPILPWKHLRWFGLILIGGLLLAGRPMLNYGFDWVSFANDDMANYSLAAQRFLEHGYFDIPDLASFFAGRDYSLSFWYMHVPGGSRAGSELMLAAVWGLTGLNAHQIFMPVILALHLALISASGAMVAGFGRRRNRVFVVMLLMAISPMTTLGALYQLIGQVGGLTLLVTAATLLYRHQPLFSAKRLLVSNLLLALVLAALFVWYPEVLPFLGLGWIVYIVLTWRAGNYSLRGVIVPALVAGTLLLALLNKYLVAMVFFLLGQASGGVKSGDLSTVLFPYFLVPSGIPALWGFVPIAQNIHEPLTSFAIAGGIVFTLWFLTKLFVYARQASPAAAMGIVMVAMGALLFTRNNDFGLFKLAMFSQPFLLGVVAMGVARTELRLGWRKYVFISVILLVGFVSQANYVSQSKGEGAGGMTEIPHASAEKVNREFEAFFRSLGPITDRGVIADTANVVLAKFQSLYSQGTSLLFPSRDYYSGIPTGGLQTATPDQHHFFHEYSNERSNYFSDQEIGSGASANHFDFYRNLAEELQKRAFLTTANKQTIFNGFREKDPKSGYFALVKEPHNYLLFVHSSLGNHYYLGDRKKIAYYQLENDPLFSGQQFSGLGRHSLFMALGPTNHPRVVLELTSTVLKQFDSQLPVAIIGGDSSQQTGFLGRGSGRVVTPPVDPVYIDGVPYLSIDMGRDGRQFPSTAKGLMLLYGRNVPLDQRRLTTFGRDISLISEEEYLSLKAPSALVKFPYDLADRNLEYSGIYEDGWISERSFFMLSPKADTRSLVIKGMVPQIDVPDFRTTLAVSVDGSEVVKKSLGLGDFEIKVPVSANDQRHRIDLAFDRYQTLPGDDGRPTGGKIEFIGFTKD